MSGNNLYRQLARLTHQERLGAISFLRLLENPTIADRVRALKDFSVDSLLSLLEE